MTDNGRYEATVEFLKAGRESTDAWRIIAGWKLARLDRAYGSQVIKDAAKDIGIGRSTAYEYIQVGRFIVCWLGLSARRIFSDYPDLTYSHLRRAMRLDYESAIEALLAVSVGDPDFPEFDSMLPMSPDVFGVYVAKVAGKPVPSIPLLDVTGTASDVWRAFTSLLNSHQNGHKIRVIVREME